MREQVKKRCIEILKEHGFKRIADGVELIWGTVELENYLSKLVITDRDNREGFPPLVFNAILRLHTLHNDEFGFNQPDISSLDPKQYHKSANA